MDALMGVRTRLEWGWGWGPVSEETGFELGLEERWREGRSGGLGQRIPDFLNPASLQLQQGPLDQVWSLFIQQLFIWDS